MQEKLQAGDSRDKIIRNDKKLVFRLPVIEIKHPVSPDYFLFCDPERRDDITRVDVSITMSPETLHHTFLAPEDHNGSVNGWVISPSLSLERDLIET